MGPGVAWWRRLVTYSARASRLTALPDAVRVSDAVEGRNLQKPFHLERLREVPSPTGRLLGKCCAQGRTLTVRVAAYGMKAEYIWADGNEGRPEKVRGLLSRSTSPSITQALEALRVSNMYYKCLLFAYSLVVLRLGESVAASLEPVVSCSRCLCRVRALAVTRPMFVVIGSRREGVQQALHRSWPLLAHVEVLGYSTQSCAFVCAQSLLAAPRRSRPCCVS